VRSHLSSKRADNVESLRERDGTQEASGDAAFGRRCLGMNPESAEYREASLLNELSPYRPAITRATLNTDGPRKLLRPLAGQRPAKKCANTAPFPVPLYLRFLRHTYPIGR
jgi:hypothetical protein